MRYLTCLLLFLLMASSVQAEDLSDAFLADFVVGRYHLIGRQTDGETTYQGRVDIFRGPQDTLKVRRTIGGRVIQGTAAIEKATLAETQVLRMRFIEAGIPFECTCLIQGDLDNYARLSCHRYRSDDEARSRRDGETHYRRDGKTIRPGLEALFHDAGTR